MCSSADPGTPHGLDKIQYVRGAWKLHGYEFRGDPVGIIQRVLGIPGSSEVDTIIELYAQDSSKPEYKWDGDTQAWHLVN
jgi:hypothetical protein